MEKQGMDRCKRSFRIGLLIFFALLLPFREMLLGAEEELPLEIQVETAPANPLVNNPWSVFILVNHPRPEELIVEPPAFPASLILERIRTDTRLIRREIAAQSEGGENTIRSERWTRIEFLFTPRRAESITLEPFEVRTRDRQGHTNEINVRIRVETVTQAAPVFRWLTPVPSVRSGLKGNLTLELSGWNHPTDVPEGFFQGRAPLNAIIEEGLPVRSDGVYRYNISVIPLKESRVILEPFPFQYANYLLSIPGINIPVLPASPLPNPGVADETSAEEEDALVFDPPFPGIRDDVFFLFRDNYNRITGEVRGLWDDKLHAEALAEIRRNERDRLIGPLLVPVRREMEDALGLGISENESWHPFRLSLVAHAIIFVVVISVAALLIILHPRFEVVDQKYPRWKPANLHPLRKFFNVTFRRGNGFILIVIFILVAGLFFIYFEERIGNFPIGTSGGAGRIAVLRRTQSYRVPDVKGAVSDMFRDGQCVTIGEFRGSWYFAETPDGRSGWVPEDTVITY